MSRVLTPLITQLDESNIETIFIVPHAGPVHCIATALIKNLRSTHPSLTWHMAGLNKIVRQEDGGWAFEWQDRIDFLSGEQKNAFTIEVK